MNTPQTDDSVALDAASTAALVDLVVKGMSRGEVERWLGPNLDYEP